MCNFLQVLQGAMLDLEDEDSWVWKVGELQTYSVNYAYVLFRQDREEELSFVYNKCGGVKFCVLHFSLLGGCWRIRLLLRSIWKVVELWSTTFCAVCVGRRRNPTTICFSIADLLYLFGVNALSDLV